MPQQTRAELDALTYGNLPDNTIGYIDPAKLREVILAGIASSLNLLDDGNPSPGPGLPTSQPAQATFGNLGGAAQDNASLVSYLAGLGHALTEYLPPLTVAQGRWYLAGTGIWEARSSFNASAQPAAGAYWRLVLDMGDALRATAAGKALLAAPTAVAQRNLLDLFTTTAGQYGSGQPAFTNAYRADGALPYLLGQVDYLRTQLVASTSPGQSTRPTVTGFLPDTAAVGATVTVTGTNFTRATAVLLNGTPASFQLLNASTLVAVVPVGATTGPVSVTTAAGTGTSAANFTVRVGATPAPTGDTENPNISFTVPAAGATLTPGTQVLLTATATDNLAVSSVTFTDGATGAVLGTGAKNGTKYTLPYTPTATGPLSLVATATDAAGNSNEATVNVTVQASTTTPVATKATSPFFGAIDDVSNVVTLGSAYSFTEVRWGVEGQGPQALASNSICSPGNMAGRLFAYVVADPATNRLPSETVYSGAFSLAATANNNPTATLSVTGGTSSVLAGQSVTLQVAAQDVDAGDTLSKNEFLDNGVKFGEIAGAAGSLQTGALAAGSHSFTARPIDSRGASGLSNAVLIIAEAPATTNPPTISGFSPTSAGIGAPVTVRGTSFTAATSVKIGSLAVNFSTTSNTELILSIPSGAVTGKISVTNAAGTAVSASTLAITAGGSSVTAISVFSPTSGVIGTVVTISGSAFGSATGTVKFNGQAATVQTWTDTQITALAPASGTGYITVTTASNIAVSSTRQFLLTDTIPFDVKTGIWGESGILRYRGCVEEDSEYANDIPAIVTQGTSGVATNEVWNSAFTPSIPHFGLEVAITNAFNPGTGQTPAGTQDFVQAGYNFATNGFIGLKWVAQTGELFYYEVRDNGSVTSISQYGVPILPPFRLAVSIADRSVTFWIKSPIAQTATLSTGQLHSFVADAWEVVGHIPLDGSATYDFRTTAMLASISRASITIGSGGNAGKNFAIAGGRFGYLMGVGTANYAPVKYADGTPYATGPRTFIGGSVATASARPTDAIMGIHTCFAAIFDVNVADNTIRQWAKFGFKRTLSDGVERVIGDNSVQWRYVAANDTWYAYAGRWGTYADTNDPLGMGVSVYKFGGSTLPKGVTVLSGATMNLPPNGGGFIEDPDMMFWQGKYHFVWSTNNAQIFTLHYATTNDLPDENANWTHIASGAPGTAIQEGAHFTVVDGALQIISTYAPGNGQNSKTRVYDTGQVQAGFLTQVGEWTRQDFFESTSPTHGNETAIREVDTDGSVHTAYYWSAFGGEKFDNSIYSWGNFHILKATRRSNGYAYPLLTLPV